MMVRVGVRVRARARVGVAVGVRANAAIVHADSIASNCAVCSGLHVTW